MEIDIEKLKAKKTTEELLEFGIINIDKPSGPTSFDTSDFVKKTLGLRKTSHFGMLDPKVTGVLPIALNRACKLTGYFLGEDKEYIGIMRMHEDVLLKKIQEIINKKFLGKIKQTPPVKSRVKRQEREREIKKFELLEKDGKDILFHTIVQGGTYIRKLLSDLGDYMKIGAHMLELRRTRACIFKEDDKNYPSVNLFDFVKAVEEFKNGNDKPLRKIIIPAEIVSELYYVIEIKKTSLEKLLTGKPILLDDLKKTNKNNFEKGKIISVFLKNRFVGMYKIVNEKEIFARPEFVLQPLNKLN
ncbi:RNA-guided pseudouridylation complex pseudouridine synthase subunit Cbf5 [archaeon]|nr:RNA-guided pseudouridylation complex pseudouridine synthase subunit Cbf5 [archaeon]